MFTTDGDQDPHPQYRLNPHPHRDLHLELLRLIEAHPTWIQRQLAGALGVSLGKTNFCVRALKEKSLVKWGNFTQNPNKLAYLHILTPEGLAHKKRLTAHFLQRKEAEYEALRAEISKPLHELHPNGANPGSRLDIDDRSLEKAGA
jgi:EPS-associated MarR family transcriptional regulator